MKKFTSPFQGHRCQVFH